MPNLPPAYIITPKIAKMQVRFHLDRFLREEGRPLTPPELEISGVYHPYWKIASLMLRVRNRLDTRLTVSEYGAITECEEKEEMRQDVSLTPHVVTVSASPALELFPYSLGLRTEYIKLLPRSGAASDEDFSFNPADTTAIQAYAQAEKVVQKLSDSSNLTNKRNLSKLYGLRAVLIYFPYQLAMFRESGKAVVLLVDGVSGRVVGDSNATENRIPESSQQQFGALGIEYHRCTNCGEDLPATNSILYKCKNCGSITTLEKHPSFTQAISSTAQDCAGRDTLLPFWSLELSTQRSEIAVRSSGSSLEHRSIVVPAFQVANFEAMYRLTTRMTTAIARLPVSQCEEIKGEVAPANVGVLEALVMAKAALARGELKQNPNGKLDNQTSLIRAALILVPFHAESYFLVDSVLSSVTIERRALTPAT